jgi:hypothetical protein
LAGAEVATEGSELLNIAKLARDHADYYLSSVARSQEEYYSGSGEAAGHCLGRVAEELGLSGQVAEAGLHGLLGHR